MAAIDEISINPTAGSVTSQYSDIALTALFNAHVNIINSERAAIWQRQTAMTLANSVVSRLMWKIVNGALPAPEGDRG